MVDIIRNTYKQNINKSCFKHCNYFRSADGATLGSASKEFSDLFLADGGTIQFGNDQEITLTHVADSGLTLKHA